MHLAATVEGIPIECLPPAVPRVAVRRGAFLLVGSSGVRVEAGWLGDVRSGADVAVACGEGGVTEHSDPAWLVRNGWMGVGYGRGARG